MLVTFLNGGGRQPEMVHAGMAAGTQVIREFPAIGGLKETPVYHDPHHEEVY